MRFIERPLPYRVRAVAGLIDGETVAVGGIAYLPDGSCGAFLMAEARARACPLALHKAALRVLHDARRRGITRLVTLADPAVDAAERWLRRLGFNPVLIGQQQVWLWQP